MKNLFYGLMPFIKTKKFFFLFILFLLSINLYIIADGFAHKNLYHIDEQWSYAHSNSNGTPYIARKSTSYQWLDSKLYHDYLTVQKSDGFNYSHIYQNIELDLHTPLYFMTLYTISYFFPDTFNPWLGGGLNIFLWLITLFVMYRFSAKFFKSRWLALAPVILYSFSIIGISTVSYIRIYMMQTLFATCLLSEMISYIEKENTKYRLTALKIFIFSLLGMLTSYNSIILSFVLSVVFGVYLLKNKEYKKIFYLASAMIGSLIFFIHLFPNAAYVLLRSYQEIQHINYLNDPLTAFIKALDIYYSELFSAHINILDHQILDVDYNSRTNVKINILEANLYGYIAILLFIYIPIIYAYYNGFKIKQNITLLFISMLIISFYAFYKMPEMHEYRDRYIMFLYPTISIISIYMFYYIFTSFLPKKKASLCLYILIFISVLSTNHQRYNPYLAKMSAEDSQIVSELENKKIVVTAKAYQLSGTGSFEAGSFIYMNADKIYILPNEFYVYMLKCKTDITFTPKFMKKVYKNINKGDYLLVYNDVETYIRYGTEIPKVDPLVICPNISGIEFIKTVKFSNLNFDVFKIKNIRDTKFTDSDFTEVSH